MNSLARALLIFVASCAVASGVFASAFIHGQLLAVGDGLIEAVPAYFASFARWQPDMMSGFPIFADPNKAYWYPIRLLHVLPNSFNAYIVFAYALAGAATYAYVRQITNSRAAGVASAFSFSAGGFMISHLGHPMIIEPTCWCCVAIWALDNYIKTRAARWLPTVSIAISVSLSAGQPQITASTIPLLFGYLIFVGFDGSLTASLRKYVEGSLTIVIGVAGAALVWIPNLALSFESQRSGLDFASYAAFSTPLDHIAAMLVYPFSGGGGARGIYHDAFIPGANFVETADYVPLAAVILAPLSLLSVKRRVAIYWLVVACAALALSLGNGTPLASVTYNIPGFNLFRIPGRHAFEFTFAMSVLAGLGLSTFGRRRHVLRIASATAALSAMLVATATSDVAKRDSGFIHKPYCDVFLAACVFEMLLIEIALFLPERLKTLRSTLASCSVIAGAGLFATTAYWQDAPPSSILSKPAYVRYIESLPVLPGQRTYTQGFRSHPELTPNIPTFWNVKEFGGYTPLQNRFSSIFLQVGLGGRILNFDSPLLDVAAVRYFVSPADDDEIKDARTPFLPADLGLFLAIGRPEAPRSISLGLTSPRRASTLTIVTALGASVDVEQGTTVATIIVSTAAGATQSFPLRAGVETAELAYDRPDVIKKIRHRRAPIFENGNGANWYVSSLHLRLRERVQTITLSMLDERAALNVRKLSLVDDHDARAYPLSSNAIYYGEPRRFRHMADIGGVSIFENRQSQPGVWIAKVAPFNVDFSSDEAVANARERLMSINLHAWAAVSSEATIGPSRGYATLVTAEPERRIIATSCQSSCLLVSSSTFNSDWVTDIDGHSARLLRTDGFLQGVIVPKGRHVVSFHYYPGSVKVGLAISTLAALALCLLTFKSALKRSPSMQIM